MRADSVGCGSKKSQAAAAPASTVLGVDSPFFPTIVLFQSRRLPWVSGGVLERSGSLERM